MTPADARSTARAHLVEARVLLASRPEGAAYNAGFAAELALKARHCTQTGLPRLPEDKKALSAAKLNTHRLDQLLKLSDTERIQRSSLQGIDWEAIRDWDNEDRYKAPGGVSHEVATRRIEQTERLCETLELYELIEAVERASKMFAAQRNTVFNLIALLQQHKGGPRLLFVSSTCFDDLERDKAVQFYELVKSEVASDVFPLIADMRIIGLDHQLVQDIMVFASMTFGCGTVRNSLFMNTGDLPMPSGKREGLFRFASCRMNGSYVHEAYVIVLESPGDLHAHEAEN